MDATASGTETIQIHNNISGQPIATALATSPKPTLPRQVRQCFGDSIPGEFPLGTNPSLLLHVLTSCNLEPQDLAKLEVTCSFFRRSANLAPEYGLSIAELAAFDMCQKRAIFNSMTVEEKDSLKQKCGGSWKLVLKYLLVGEVCYRREKMQVIAGPGHSIVVTSNGAVYSFGSNSMGQLGHGPTPSDSNTGDEYRPRLIRSLQGIRIIHAATGAGRTMLVSDSGKVYTFGKDVFALNTFNSQGSTIVDTPMMVESLKDIFVVQVAIGCYFTAVLSREGKVYTFFWGSNDRHGHHSDLSDVQPYPLLGPLENLPVAQIAAGYCFLLALVFQPSGLSVYSLGCGLGGKLGHGTKTNEIQPRLMEHFQTINFKPMVLTAGEWHSVIVGDDGRVCTWGWGNYGCLGHDSHECETLPKVIEALSNVKVVHVAAGDYTTFVVGDDGDVYSFGYGESSSLGHGSEPDEQGIRHGSVLTPKLVTCLKQVKEKIVQISISKSISNNISNSHTFVLTESGKLYAFGSGDKGQLGVKLGDYLTSRSNPELVDIDLK